jgi:hypothetical protein
MNGFSYSSYMESGENAPAEVRGAIVYIFIRGPFEKFVDWRQCSGVLQREAVSVMPSCSGGGKIVVA